ncbi:hypothetical protein BU24DRAFT_487848 [Aaosphaeria arxii CBS 175.79]|uniref:BTB domain-containing protein n=1 Tax=Aaosphaeria arxii CBS 175.79 TaxID=1450172 RepID=A0A6A5Y849_9PLEO|nr:uncharacterized protein BU24DRAFT_487848 [Aaosphaeria arxii CBS 175.79]KAF2021423.1 hypothetical protein BU24DRAFT_487848 [Aaosphaeria arxii CBS 175.79]
MATITIDYGSNSDVELVLPANIATTPLDLEVPPNFTYGNTKVRVKEFRLRASSEKLMSSSSYFRAMFDGIRFREAQDLKEHGFAAVQLLDPEDDPSAMQIILGILYSSDVQVPDDIDLQTLYDIAKLVDKYFWHESVAPRAVSWFERLQGSQGLPDSFDETLFMWMWIAWVFEIQDSFKKLSRLAQQCATKSIDPADKKILLPYMVIDAINNQREAGFQIIEKKFVAFKKALIEDNGTEADKSLEYVMLRSLVLGHATFLARDLKLGDFAATDHFGSSIRMVTSLIKSVRYTKGVWVDARNCGHGQFTMSEGGRWDFKCALEKVVESLKMDDWGIELTDFKPLSGTK